MPPPNLQISHYNVDTSGGLYLFVARQPGAVTDISDADPPYYFRGFVDRHDPTVVGYTLIEVTEDHARPAQVMVDDDYQRQGIATELYRTAEQTLGRTLEPGYGQGYEAREMWKTHKWRAGLTELGRKVFGQRDPRFAPQVDENYQKQLQDVAGYLHGTPEIARATDDEFTVVVLQNSRKLYIKNDQPQKPVPAGNWMDWWEPDLGVTEEEYGRLPREQRAELECQLQLKLWVKREYYNLYAQFYNTPEHDKWWWDEGGKEMAWGNGGGGDTLEQENEYWKNRMKQSSLRFGAGEVATVMVDMPWSLRQEVIELGKKIPEDELFIDPDPDSFTKGRESEPHVTVLHGLRTDDPSEVQRLVADFGIIKGSLGKTSLFSNEERDVLKVEIKSNDLVRLNKVLRDNLEFESDFPDYNPHITIAYLKPGEGKKYQGSEILEGKEFTVGECFFSYDHKLTRIYLDKRYAAVKKSVMRKLGGWLTGGGWLSPTGEFISVPQDTEHPSVAVQIAHDRYEVDLPPPGFLDDSHYYDASRFLYNKGWVRIGYSSIPTPLHVAMCKSFSGEARDSIIEYMTRNAPLDDDLLISETGKTVVTFRGTVRDFLDKPELTSSLHKQADLLDDISVVQLPTLWYENEDGSKQYVPTEDDYKNGDLPPEWIKYQVSRFPRMLRTTWLKLNDDGTSSELMSGESGYNGDLVMAIVDTGKFDFDEAVIIAAETCERCLNVLLYELGFPDGYPKDSEEYRRSNTKCEFCTPKEKITGDLHSTGAVNGTIAEDLLKVYQYELAYSQISYKQQYGGEAISTEESAQLYQIEKEMPGLLRSCMKWLIDTVTNTLKYERTHPRPNEGGEVRQNLNAQRELIVDFKNVLAGAENAYNNLDASDSGTWSDYLRALDNIVNQMHIDFPYIRHLQWEEERQRPDVDEDELFNRWEEFAGFLRDQGKLTPVGSMLERGFWYLNGKLYDVSSEGGGGHHFGFIMAFEEPEVFGLSRRQQKALQGFYSDDPDRGQRETPDTQSAFQTIWNTGAIRIGFFPHGNAQIVVETKDPGSRLTEIQGALLATGVPIDPTSRILIDDWDENTFYDTSYDEIFSGDLPRPTRSSLTFPNQLYVMLPQ